MLPINNTKIEESAFFKLSYGIFILSAKDGEKDNGCVINTASLLTDSPKRIAVFVNKSNYTRDMIVKTGVFNISVLTESTTFDLIKRFGFSSGRDTDKFAGFSSAARAENGVLYLTEHTNAVLCAKVVSYEDVGTHTIFIAEITEAKTLCAEPSATYDYYFKHIKPAPKNKEEKKKGFVCKICGYVYEGEELPADFVCPLCKHGAEDFEPLK